MSRVLIARIGTLPTRAGALLLGLQSEEAELMIAALRHLGTRMYAVQARLRRR